jgi:hypothetical protein
MLPRGDCDVPQYLTMQPDGQKPGKYVETVLVAQLKELSRYVPTVTE